MQTRGKDNQMPATSISLFFVSVLLLLYVKLRIRSSQPDRNDFFAKQPPKFIHRADSFEITFILRTLNTSAFAGVTARSFGSLGALRENVNLQTALKNIAPHGSSCQTCPSQANPLATFMTFSCGYVSSGVLTPGSENEQKNCTRYASMTTVTS